MKNKFLKMYYKINEVIIMKKNLEVQFELLSAIYGSKRGDKRCQN